MDMIGKIRRLHSREKMSVRGIARKTGLSRNTITKWLMGPVSEPKYRRGPQPKKLDAYAEAVVTALKASPRTEADPWVLTGNGPSECASVVNSRVLRRR